MKGRHRILLLANNFPPTVGGSAVVYGYLAAHAHGEITVMAPRLSYVDGLPIIGWREHDRHAGYPVLRLRQLRTQMAHDAPRDWWSRLRRRFDDLLGRLMLLPQILIAIPTWQIGTICFGEALHSRWIIRCLRYLAPVRTAIYVHGEELLIDDDYDPGHRRIQAALLDADLIFAVSGFTHEAIVRLIGEANRGKIVRNENGVDTSRFRPLGRRSDLVDRYRLDGCFVFVSVCRLIEKKGIDIALHAFARVVARHPECRLLIVGRGPQELTLRDLATSLGVAAQVVFAGGVPAEDLAAHYCLGDVFVMPNRTLENGDTEGFGLVFLEANACGLPVIGGQYGGTASAITDGENGFRVDSHHIAPVAEAMLRLREDDPLRADMGAKGRLAAGRADWRSKAAIFVHACQERTRR